MMRKLLLSALVFSAGTVVYAADAKCRRQC